MRVRLLRRFLAAESGRDFVPNRSFLDRFEAMLSAPSPELRLLPVDAERTLALRNESVSFLRNSPANPAAWRWRELPETVWNGFRLAVEPVSAAGPVTLYEALFDADALPDELILDRRRDGDRLGPLRRSKAETAQKAALRPEDPGRQPASGPGARMPEQYSGPPASATRTMRRRRPRLSASCASPAAAIPAEVQGAGTGTPSGN